MRRHAALIAALTLTLALAAPALADTTRSFDSGTANRLFYRSQTAPGQSPRVIKAQPLIGKPSTSKTAAATGTRKPTYASSKSNSRVIRSTHTVHSRHIAHGQHGNVAKASPKTIHHVNHSPRVTYHGNSKVVDYRHHGGKTHHTAYRTSSSYYKPHTTHYKHHGSHYKHHGSHYGHKSLKTVWGHGYYPLGVYNHRTVFAKPHYGHYGHSSYYRPYSYGCYRPSYGHHHHHHRHYGYGSHLKVGYHDSKWHVGFGIRF